MNMQQLLIPAALTVSLAISTFTADATLIQGNEKWTLKDTLAKSISQVRSEQTGSQWVLPDLGEVNQLLQERGLTHGLGFKHDVDSKARLTSVGLDSTHEGFWGLAMEYPTNTVWMVDVILKGNTYQWKNWRVPNDDFSKPASTVFLKTVPVSVPFGPETSPVPIPGAAWLFGSAIVGLIIRRKLWNKK